MALRGKMKIAGCEVQNAYVRIHGISGGKQSGQWVGEITIISAALADAMRASLTAKKAAEVDRMRAGVAAAAQGAGKELTDALGAAGTAEQSANQAYATAVNAACGFIHIGRIAAAFDETQHNPYNLLYAQLRRQPEFAELVDD